MSETLLSTELNALIEALPTAEIEAPLTATDTPFFRILASTKRELLADLITERQCGTGEFIVKEGAPGEALYIVWSGRAVVMKGEYESPTFIAYRTIGEIIGEMSLLADQPRSASVIALEPTRLLCISRNNFQRLLSNNPAVGRSLLDVLSRRLRLANEVRNSKLQSEKWLLERVSELQSENEQLLQLQHLRQETSSLIVHDLRNPLGNIYTSIKMLELVLPETVLKENQQLLEIASLNCERMQHLVDDLLDVERMESGEVTLIWDEMDLKTLIETAINRVTTTLQWDGISVEIEIAADLATVTADAEKIDRVMINLLDNASKYTGNNGVIKVAAEQVEDYIQVSVTDTGPGVPPEDRERIFERFARGSRNRPRIRGFGLGLVFCRLAVEAHGGRIWTEPGPDDVGSRFVFTLPVNQIEQ